MLTVQTLTFKRLRKSFVTAAITLSKTSTILITATESRGVSFFSLAESLWFELHFQDMITMGLSLSDDKGLFYELLDHLECSDVFFFFVYDEVGMGM